MNILTKIRGWFVNQDPEVPSFSVFPMPPPPPFKMPKIVHAELTHNSKFGQGILNIKWDDGKEEQYVECDGAIRSYPMFKKIDEHLEWKLDDIYSYIANHGNPYPTAHENKKQPRK